MKKLALASAIATAIGASTGAYAGPIGPYNFDSSDIEMWTTGPGATDIEVDCLTVPAVPWSHPTDLAIAGVDKDTEVILTGSVCLSTGGVDVALLFGLGTGFEVLNPPAPFNGTEFHSGGVEVFVNAFGPTWGWQHAYSVVASSTAPIDCTSGIGAGLQWSSPTTPIIPGLKGTGGAVCAASFFGVPAELYLQ